MASHCVPEVLGIEVSKGRPTATAKEPARIDSADGTRQSKLGRIANELKLKLGIRVSPRTIRKYLVRKRPGGGGTDQRWATFLRNQAKGIVTCDFFISVTLTFRVLYVFVAMEIGSRPILHCKVTAHPTAERTTQQFREVLDDVVFYNRGCPHSFWQAAIGVSFPSITTSDPSRSSVGCITIIGWIRRWLSARRDFCGKQVSRLGRLYETTARKLFRDSHHPRRWAIGSAQSPRRWFYDRWRITPRGTKHCLIE